MPMTQENRTRLQGRPELRGTQGPQALQVQAQQQQHAAAQPQMDPDLSGLIQGLSSLAPGLQQYTQRQQAFDEQQQQQEAVNTGTRVAAMHEDPSAVLRNGEVQDIAGMPPAWNEAFKAAAFKTIAQRVGAKNKTDILTEYETQKNEEGFDSTKFLAEWRGKALQGITDGPTAAYISAHLDDASNSIRVDQNRVLMKKREETLSAGLQHSLAEGILPNMTPAQMQPAIQQAIQTGESFGKPKAEVMHRLFNHLDQMSRVGDGQPEMLQVLVTPMADGKTPLDYAPELTDRYQAALAQADKLRHAAFIKGRDGYNQKAEETLNVALETNPASIWENREQLYREHVGDGRVFKDFRSFNDFTLKAFKKMQEGKDVRDDTAALLRGEGFTVPTAARQSAALDKIMEPLQKGMLEYLREGNVQGINAVARQMMGKASQFQVNVPVGFLKNYFGTVVTSLPSDKGPDATFKSAAAMYAALQDNPQFRDMHIPEKLGVVLDAYNKQVDIGGDPATAYRTAFAAGNPDAGSKLTREQRDQFAKEAQTWVSGHDKWLPKIFNGTKVYQTPEVSEFATREYMRLRELYPTQPDERLQQSVKNAIGQNFVAVQGSGQPVRVPPGISKQEASEYLGDIVKAGADALAPMGGYSVNIRGMANGMVAIEAVDQNLTPVATFKTINLEAALAERRKRKLMSPEETKALGLMVQSSRGGSSAPVDMDLLSKARSNHAVSDEDYDRLVKVQIGQMQAMFQKVPDLGFGKPGASQVAALPSKGKVDASLTAQLARSFYVDPSVNGSQRANSANTLGMAMSLVAMSEGALTVRDSDPNKAAGDNIACGYNLNANAATIAADFKAAGIPPEHLEDIKAGRRALSPQQVTNLTRIAVTARMKAVETYAMKNYPGVWQQMTDAQRAVMIDIQYQVKGGAGQFQEAWKALQAGDTAKFQQSIKVFYSKTGGKADTFDSRRHDLRAALLQGGSAWQAKIDLLSRAPSSKLDSRRLLNQQ